MPSCGPVTEVAKEMWAALERGETADAAWDVLRGRGNVRRLEPGRTLADRLERTESRLFVLPAPLEAEVTLELEKLGGWARAVFSVCTTDRNLQVTPLWRVTLAGGRNRRGRFVKTLGARGILSVYVEVESAVYGLEYALTLRSVGPGQGPVRA